MTDQQTIELIDSLTGDDFCVELDTKLAFRPEQMTDTEKSAAEKLALIYRIAHSMNQANACYRAHETWRKEAEALHAAMESEKPAPAKSKGGESQ